MNKVVFIFLLLTTNISSALDHSYQEWNYILNKYVVKVQYDTYFQYLNLKKDSDDLKKFESVLSDMSDVKQTEYNKWSDSKKLAFLFNSYNAFTVKMILNHHSEDKKLKSIKDIGSFFKSTWKIKFFKFLGENSNLDRLEHEIARKNFDEPRLHVAFNCASKGCPNLLNSAFNSDTLDKQLDQASKDFMNNPIKNYYDKKSKTLHLSSIFKWYGDDFDKSSKFKNLNHFVVTHMNLIKSEKDMVLADKVKISFLDYDWKLNEYHK